MASTIIFYLVFAANLLLAGFLGWSLYDTHLIPSQYVYLAAGLLILIPLLLFLLQKEKKGQHKKTGARVAAIVLLLFLSILEGAGAYFVHQYNSKMRNVTEVHSQYTRPRPSSTLWNGSTAWACWKGSIPRPSTMCGGMLKNSTAGP